MALPLYDSITAQANVTVGAAAALPTFAGRCNGVLLQSDPTNTGNIYLGSDNTLTTAGVKAWGVLRPGEWRMIPLNSTAEIWVAAATSSKLLVGVAA